MNNKHKEKPFEHLTNDELYEDIANRYNQAIFDRIERRKKERSIKASARPVDQMSRYKETILKDFPGVVKKQDSFSREC